MALIKCKDCGNEVSSKAESCPKCGAKVKKKGIGLFGWIGILFLVGVVAAAVAPHGGSSSSSTEASSSPRPKSPKEEALSSFEVKKLNWRKGGFENVMLVDATFQNNGKRDVKDIELECTHYSNSGTRIDSNKKVIYEVVSAGKVRSVKDFSMGFIHSQASKTSCEVTDIVVI